MESSGEVQMIDVGGKPVTRRRATARATVVLDAAVARRVAQADLPKGDALTVSRVAAIMAAKRTPDILPLCHPLPLSHVSVDARVEGDRVVFEVTCETTARTGVEMEAMTGASAAALCLYDMTKALDPSGAIEGVVLLRKSGGKSGEWERP